MQRNHLAHAIGSWVARTAQALVSVSVGLMPLGADGATIAPRSLTGVRFEGHDALVTHVAFLNDGKTMVSASQDNTVRMWDVERHSLLRTWPCTIRSAAGEYSRAWSSFGRTALFVSDQGIGGMFYRTSGGHVRWYPQVWQTKSDYVAFLTLDLPDVQFGSTVCSADGRWIAAYVYHVPQRAKSVRVYDFERAAVLPGFVEPDGKPPGLLHEWEIGDDPAAVLLSHAIQFSPDGRQLAVVRTRRDRKTAAELWDLPQGKRRWQVLPEHGPEVRSFSFSPSGSYLALTVGSDTVEIRNRQSGTLVDTISLRGAQIDTAIYSPTGDRIAAAGSHGPVFLWSFEARATAEVLDVDPHHELCSCAWSPDGRWLATAGGQGGEKGGFGELKLWRGKEEGKEGG